MPVIYWDESLQLYFERAQAAPVETKDAKGAKKVEVQAADENQPKPVPIPYFKEADILLDRAFSDDKEKFKSIN